LSSGAKRGICFSLASRFPRGDEAIGAWPDRLKISGRSRGRKFRDAKSTTNAVLYRFNGQRANGVERWQKEVVLKRDLFNRTATLREEA